MDPMSAITAGLGALTAIFGAVGGIADAVKSFAGLCGKVYDALSGMIQVPQQQEAQQTTEKATQGWPQGQRDYAANATSNVFSMGAARTPQAA